MSNTDREKNFLNEINHDLPSGVDWKQGAIDYLEQLIRSEGDHNEIYHFIKPFLGGPDFAPFFNDMYGFLNMLHYIDLPMKSKVLDVACGPGWTSHFLAKLGHYALGIDISEDLVKIAKKRVSMDKFSPFKHTPLTADFMIHDIEKKPLEVDTQFDCAFFESALHHFFDPIAVIRHISGNIRPDGILCIREAAAPNAGSPESERGIEIMNKYKTLERPYTRSQFIKLLSICGYGYYEFYSQVNGLFNSRNEKDRILLNNQLSSGDNWNICIASRTNDFFKNKSRSTSFPIPSSQSFTQLGKKFHRLAIIKALWSALAMHSQEKYVSALYSLLLNRKPDADGIAHHMAHPDSFIYRLKMLWSFMNSEEHNNRHST